MKKPELRRISSQGRYNHFDTAPNICLPDTVEINTYSILMKARVKTLPIGGNCRLRYIIAVFLQKIKQKEARICISLKFSPCIMSEAN